MSALKTRAFTRFTRINEWQGYIRVLARENKAARINATFSTPSFFSVTKLLATGDRARVKFNLRIKVHNTEDMPDINS